MKYSIVIPTAFAKRKELLQPCLESIIKYTDLSDTEVIVIANGCTDDTLQYVYSLGSPFHVIDTANPIGYPAAINLGIKCARGEFIVLLNNDTVLLEQPKNQWLDILTAPFADPKVGITGPWKNQWKHIDPPRKFLIFFCAMLRKSMIEQIGPLDEIFGAGYSDDVDMCFRAEDAGWKLVQVPEETELPYDGVRAHGNFPMYHVGNATFKDRPDDSLIHKNHAIVVERYGVNIANAQKLGEWVSDKELMFLGKQAKKSKVAIELGSWLGKSATVIADNLPPEGVLYCADHWRGSLVERETNHAIAKEKEGDRVYSEFCSNLWPHIQSGKVKPLRMSGKNASEFLKSKGIAADLIFVDAGHEYAEVKEDIQNFVPLLKSGGVLCGHDYAPHGPGVIQAVNEFWPKIELVDTVWFTNEFPNLKPNVFDCFTFNNELDILEKRLSDLWNVVDRFIIVEGNLTHSCRSKELVFHNNLKRFEKWLSKITYIVVEDWPVRNGPNDEESAWIRERHQRAAILRGLTSCKDNDVIIISDVDEIPFKEVIQNYNPTEGLKALEMVLFIGSRQTIAEDKWLHAKIMPYSWLKQSNPENARYAKPPDIRVIENAGEHLSYFGGVDAIIEKIHNTAHRNIDTWQFVDRGHIQDCLDKGKDFFNRPIKYKKI